MDDGILKKVAIIILVVISAAFLIPAFFLALADAINTYEHTSNKLCSAFASFIKNFWEDAHFFLLSMATLIASFYTIKFLYYSRWGSKFLNIDNSIHSNLSGNIFESDNVEAGNFIDHNVKQHVFSAACVVIFIFYAFLFFGVIGMPMMDFVYSFGYKMC